MSKAIRRVAVLAGVTGATYAGITTYTAPPKPTAADRVALAHGGLEKVPSRQLQINRLRASSPEKPFDVLVVGGGATGAASALDATLRDLKVAMVEREDFGSGTSSRSTKLIHGGVRYLEKAFFNLDPGQLKLVFEALSERAVMLNQAPHLAHPLPTLLPCYKLWEVPFYWAGLKAYDVVAAIGHGLLHFSKFLSASEALRLFPTLSKSSSGQKLQGGILYYDGQMDDARFNISVALTSALYGAAVSNHTEVVSLLREGGDQGQIKGARCRDVLTGEEFDVHARVVINATGPFTDGLRKMENPKTKDMIVPSSGVHVTLPSYYSAEGMGLIVPKTKDGRVVFMLPWLGATIAGTTDSKTEITKLPRAHADEVQFILDALSDYLRIDVRARDVQSAWAGIRPLALDPSTLEEDEIEEGDDKGKKGKKKSTSNIVREHIVTVSEGNLVTITGGKWTTQRVMGEHAVDAAVKAGGLEDRASRCKTRFVRLIGAHTWDESYFAFLAQRYITQNVSNPKKNAPAVASEQLDVECAQHLSRAYGDQAYRIAELAEQGFGRRLVEGYPIIEAEVPYCMDYEYCETAVDFLSRRCRLVFLDGSAARLALPRVVDIMAKHRGWNEKRKREELVMGNTMIDSFTLPNAPATA